MSTYINRGQPNKMKSQMVASAGLSKPVGSLSGLLLEMILDVIKQLLPNALCKTQEKSLADYCRGNGFQFSYALPDVLHVMRMADNRANPSQGYLTTRQQLQVLLKKQSRQNDITAAIIKMLLLNFNVLSRQTECLSLGIIPQISEHTLRHIALMNGQDGQLTYDGLILFRALATPAGIRVEEVSTVMKKMSGMGWQHLITEDSLKAFLAQSNLLWQERHVALLLLNHFARISHYSLEDAMRIIEMSDIQALIQYNADLSFRHVVTRESVTERELTLEEKIQIEYWLDKNGLDENGCPVSKEIPSSMALMGYFDRYDRILSENPQCPWKKFK